MVMSKPGAEPIRHLAFTVGLLLGSWSGACTSGRVVVGEKLKDGRTDGAVEVAGPGGSVGCTGNATPPTSPANGYLDIDVNGTARQYVLELPTSYDGMTPVSVLFAFHGSGTSGQDFLGQDYGNVRGGVAGRLLLVAPNALPGSSDLFAWVDWSGDQGNGVTRADLDMFDAILGNLKVNYCIDAGRVFAMGHGDGAIIANQLGCIRGDVVRGVAAFAGAGPEERTVSCTGKVAALIGHNPKEGDAAECGRVTGGSCPWTLLWADTGWPTTQYWAQKNGCADPGVMPTAAFAGDSYTGNPLPCQTLAGCGDPVTLCLYDYWNRWDGPHALPSPWAARAATDFFLALPRVR